jgi:hypothetical protein
MTHYITCAEDAIAGDVAPRGRHLSKEDLLRLGFIPCDAQGTGLGTPEAVLAAACKMAVSELAAEPEVCRFIRTHFMENATISTGYIRCTSVTIRVTVECSGKLHVYLWCCGNNGNLD